MKSFIKTKAIFYFLLFMPNTTKPALPPSLLVPAFFDVIEDDCGYVWSIFNREGKITEGQR